MLIHKWSEGSPTAKDHRFRRKVSHSNQLQDWKGRKALKTEQKVVCFELINDHLLAGCFDGSYMEIDVFRFDIKMKEQKESNYMTSIMNLPGNILVVGLDNGILKVYSY